jgi:hypothetical protein
VILYAVKEKGGKPRKTTPPSLWFKKSIQNLKKENSHSYAHKPQRNCTFMNSAFEQNMPRILGTENVTEA